MVDAPITCQLLSHSIACHPPTVNKKKKVSETGPKWAEDKSAGFCQSCGFQFNVVIRRHHCRHCGNLFCRYCAQDLWPLPKFEYLHPVRICRKCSRLCWKAEALVQYVERKNDCNLHTGVLSPLTMAASEGFSEVCRVLISGKADVNYAVPAFRHTTIVTCDFCHHTDAHLPNRTNKYECQRCHEITHTLSNTDKAAAFRGQSPSDHVGMTALHAAVRRGGHMEVVRALLQNGATVDARTHNGNTPLMLAAANGFTDCCTLLIRHRADVRATCDYDGDTALHRAVREGHAAVVAILVHAGAPTGLDSDYPTASAAAAAGSGAMPPPAVKNLEGLSPAQLSQRRPRPDIIAALHGGAAPPGGAVLPSAGSGGTAGGLAGMGSGGGRGPSGNPPGGAGSDEDDAAVERKRSAAGGSNQTFFASKTDIRVAGDALEEELEIAARRALDLVDDD